MEGSHLPVEAGESQWCTHCCCSTGRVPLQLHVSSTGVKCFAVGVLGVGSLSLSQPSHSSEEWPVAKLREETSLGHCSVGVGSDGKGKKGKGGTALVEY